MEHLPHQHSHEEAYRPLSFPKEQELQALSELFRLLSDPSRLRLFWLLCHCEECVINLSAITGTSSPALSHHLKLLKTAGLIVSRREGKEVYYRAAETEEAKVLHRMAEALWHLTCPKKK